jgi:hypothetical protein
MTDRDNYNEEDRQREEAIRKNSVEPTPQRGEDGDLEDVDPKYRDKVADAFKPHAGESEDNNEDSRIDQPGSRHGKRNN